MSLVLRLCVVLVGLSALPSAFGRVACLNEDGVEVGWWVIFKRNNARDYAYLDADTYPSSGPVKMTGRDIECGTSCALGATLTQLVSNSSVVRVTWNDAVPTTSSDSSTTSVSGAEGAEEEDELLDDTDALLASLASGTGGHAKGVLGADAEGGFWMTHSIPKFPDLASSPIYLPSIIYGQVFLCVSVDAENMEVAAAGVKNIDPKVYASVVPSGALSSLYPTIVGLLAGARTTGSAARTVHSRTGTIFTHYAKSGSTGLDLWEDVVQKDLQVDMFVESWRRSPPMATYCRPDYAYDSMNVATMTYVDASGNPINFKYTQDHTKMGVATNVTSAYQYACVSDNNRMTSQWVRGGGAVCFKNAGVYKAYKASLDSIDGCPGGR